MGLTDKLGNEDRIGQITITGNHVYHTDCFRVKVPDAKNKQYITRRAKIQKALKEAMQNGEM